MADWIVVVDDDSSNLKMAGHILSKANMRVTAFQNGKGFLDYIQKEKMPDLILLDILMPNMDGFAVLEQLRLIEAQKGVAKTPVVFLTAGEDKEMETKGFAAGAMDFIRKPFEPEALVHRIRNILSNERRLHALSEEAFTDAMTGLLNKNCMNRDFPKICRDADGAVMVIDLDSFKLINDIYGHDAGDQTLVTFAQLLRQEFKEKDLLGRIGGDEFLVFARDCGEGEELPGIIQNLNVKLVEKAKEILGEDMTIPLGVSSGIALCKKGEIFEDLFKKADATLLNVKKNGKHGCDFYREETAAAVTEHKNVHNLETLDMILEERNVGRNAMWLEQDAFCQVYRYMVRYIMRYHEEAQKLLFTLNSKKDNADPEVFTDAMMTLGDLLNNALRNSDIMMRNADNQYFLLLPFASEEDIIKVIERLMQEWEKTGYGTQMELCYETAPVEEKPDGDEGKQA